MFVLKPVAFLACDLFGSLPLAFGSALPLGLLLLYYLASHRLGLWALSCHHVYGSGYEYVSACSIHMHMHMVKCMYMHMNVDIGMGMDMSDRCRCVCVCVRVRIYICFCTVVCI